MQDDPNVNRMPTKLDHALRLVLEDLYIFPLLPNAKTPPAGIEWRKQSTKNKETIKNWFKLNSDYNIAVDTGKSGLVVVDKDISKGKQGEEGYNLLAVNGWPETFTIETASGGEHYYYKSGIPYRNTSNKLHNGLDTRGDGGYVVAPGSTINNNQYKISKNLMIADMPEWLGTLLKESKSSTTEKKKDVIANDENSDILKAKHWLINTAQLAIENDGGDHTTFTVAAKLKDFGLSKITTLNLMLEHWNNRCSPPWQPDILEIKVDNAYKYSQQPQGVLSTANEFDPVTLPKPELWLPVIKNERFGNIPRREWVFGNIALCKKLTLLVAPPGVGKSTWTLLIALSKASGQNIAGFDPKGIGTVAVHNQEDDEDELYRRTEALMLQCNLTKDDIKDRLLLGSGEQRMFKIAKKNQNGLLSPADMQSFTERLIETNTQLLIVDPFSETHDGEENNNVDVLQVATMYRQMAQKANCAVLVSHHSRKPPGAGSEGFSGDMNTSRGASSLLGVARIVLTLEAMSEQDAVKHGINPDEKHLYVRLDTAKANMTLASGRPSWYKKCNQIIGSSPDDIDGERVGTLVPIEPRDPRFTPETPIFSFICHVEDALAIELEIQDEKRIAISIIAKGMISAHSEYCEYSADALTKKIRRLFDNGMVPGARGEMYIVEEDQVNRGKRAFITYKPL